MKKENKEYLLIALLFLWSIIGFFMYWFEPMIPGRIFWLYGFAMCGMSSLILIIYLKYEDKLKYNKSFNQNTRKRPLVSG